MPNPIQILLPSFYLFLYSTNVEFPSFDIPWVLINSIGIDLMIKSIDQKQMSWVESKKKKKKVNWKLHH